MEEFEQRWLAFVRRFAEASVQEREALVAGALTDGLPDLDAAAVPPVDVPLEHRVEAEMSVIGASGEFDAFGYWWHNQDRPWNLCGAPEELRHFVTHGWKELRHPSPSFDLWFYWSTHLDPTSEAVNPFLHHLLEGRRAGLATLPEVRTLEPARAPTAPLRRICLFAAYDVDGVVDPTVVDYLADLSRHADVYYLADCDLDPGELEKVAPHTKGRWAIRHGRYDFGSYSMLARDLVGWDVIEGYDELLLANDSCYLVQPFDRVFERMDATACDWWGLQATYEEMRRLALWRYNDFIHVGSYFVGYRKRVIDDPEFRARLDSVAAQSSKTTIILKYEIGFSRLLILGGYHLATFVDGILPYHPVYRETAFELMHAGFPLLKRQLLYENPFNRPDLRLWKERVLEACPDADVVAMERNLLRVAPAWKLERSFGFRSRPDGSVEGPRGIGPDTFDDEDRWAPKHPHWWVFPVDPRTGVLPGELRGLLDAVRDDPSIHKIVLSAHRPVKVTGERVTVVPAESGPGQMYALRAGHVFVTAGPRSDVNHPLSARHHRFVRVGSPTGLEPPRVALTGLWGRHDPPPESYERSLVTDVVVSSDTLVGDAVAVHPRVEPSDVWVIGSPRMDLLLADEADLSPTLRADLSVLRAAVGGRRVVVVSPLSATAEEAAELARWAEDHEDVAVLWAAPPGWTTPVPLPLVDLYDAARLRPGSLRPHPVQPEMAWRLADVLATGWTSDLADASVPGVPTVALPGASGSPLVEHPTLADGLVAVETFLDGTPVDEAWLAWGRSLHTASDGRSGARLARRVKAGYLPLDEWERDLSAG